MTQWLTRQMFDVVAVRRRLGLVLVAVVAYWAAAALTIGWMLLPNQ